ncbi:hypothetical protein DIPPA_05263 [Diplonema papillatum]|nr:hypothetical protein DIPPA_05263 [Diplonema papillatum]
MTTENRGNRAMKKVAGDNDDFKEKYEDLLRAGRLYREDVDALFARLQSELKEKDWKISELRLLLERQDRARARAERAVVELQAERAKAVPPPSHPPPPHPPPPHPSSGSDAGGASRSQSRPAGDDDRRDNDVSNSSNYNNSNINNNNTTTTTTTRNASSSSNSKSGSRNAAHAAEGRGSGDGEPGPRCPGGNAAADGDDPRRGEGGCSATTAELMGRVVALLSERRLVDRRLAELEADLSAAKAGESGAAARYSQGIAAVEHRERLSRERVRYLESRVDSLATCLTSTPATLAFRQPSPPFATPCGPPILYSVSDAAGNAFRDQYGSRNTPAAQSPPPRGQTAQDEAHTPAAAAGAGNAPDPSTQQHGGLFRPHSEASVLSAAARAAQAPGAPYARSFHAETPSNVSPRRSSAACLHAAASPPPGLGRPSSRDASPAPAQPWCAPGAPYSEHGAQRCPEGAPRSPSARANPTSEENGVEFEGAPRRGGSPSARVNAISEENRAESEGAPRRGGSPPARVDADSDPPGTGAGPPSPHACGDCRGLRARGRQLAAQVAELTGSSARRAAALADAAARETETARAWAGERRGLEAAAARLQSECRAKDAEAAILADELAAARGAWAALRADYDKRVSHVGQRCRQEILTDPSLYLRIGQCGVAKNEVLPPQARANALPETARVKAASEGAPVAAWINALPENGAAQRYCAAVRRRRGPTRIQIRRGRGRGRRPPTRAANCRGLRARGRQLAAQVAELTGSSARRAAALADAAARETEAAGLEAAAARLQSECRAKDAEAAILADELAAARGAWAALRADYDKRVSHVGQRCRQEILTDPSLYVRIGRCGVHEWRRTRCNTAVLPPPARANALPETARVKAASEGAPAAAWINALPENGAAQRYSEGSPRRDGSPSARANADSDPPGTGAGAAVPPRVRRLPRACGRAAGSWPPRSRTRPRGKPRPLARGRARGGGHPAPSVERKDTEAVILADELAAARRAWAALRVDYDKRVSHVGQVLALVKTLDREWQQEILNPSLYLRIGVHE